MRRLVAIVALGALLVAASPLSAHAHGGAALGLAAFAAFTSLVALPLVAAAAAAPYYPPYPVYAVAPAAYYAAPPASYPVRTAPAIQREVVYPHGRHVLYGDGIRTAYQWVWVPNPPVPPAASVAVPPPPAGPPPPPPPAR